MGVRGAFRTRASALVLFRFRVPLPFGDFTLLNGTPLNFLFPYSNRVLVVNPRLPRSYLVVLSGYRLSRLLVHEWPMSSFRGVLYASASFCYRRSVGLGFYVRPSCRFVKVQ